MFAIHSAQPDDLQAVLLVLKGCSLPFEDVTIDQLGHFLVLDHSKSVVGCVGIEPLGTDALLRSLAVFDAMRGDGWGGELLRAIEAYARSLGVSTLYLLTTTAAVFFEERGYRRINRASAPEALQETTQFSLLCPSSSTCLFKSISSNLSKEIT